jgi:hypothetical protein
MTMMFPSRQIDLELKENQALTLTGAQIFTKHKRRFLRIVPAEGEKVEVTKVENLGVLPSKAVKKFKSATSREKATLVEH